jgi:leucyl-tRNA synthetase
MADKYDPQEIEPKWQKQWEADGLYIARKDPDKPKWYFLTMLPYTSGDMHVGHWYPLTPSDAAARYKRMRGYNVFFPIGFDAFGLPAENAAIKRDIHPYIWTMSNIENMRRQIRSMGAMWTWDHEAITCLPEYYKWTQWFFLKFYEMGLAYWDTALVDFCPHCDTVLAREQVWGEDRHCERCKTPVIKKNVPHWKFRITKYADELLGFSQIDWPQPVRVMQTNWIGRSEGAEVVFTSEEGDDIPVFTTRPDTLWGATFMVLSPEHPLVAKLTSEECREAVEAYQV